MKKILIGLLLLSVSSVYAQGGKVTVIQKDVFVSPALPKTVPQQGIAFIFTIDSDSKVLKVEATVLNGAAQDQYDIDAMVHIRGDVLYTGKGRVYYVQWCLGSSYNAFWGCNSFDGFAVATAPMQ